MNHFVLKCLIKLQKMSIQHRTFYCYLVLSIWIFLLIGGMYKYIGNINNVNFLNTRQFYAPMSEAEEQNMKITKYKLYCSPIERITRKDDGGMLTGWKLQGVLLVIRHGDRGPMSHVKGISSINCGVERDLILNKYKSFLYNSTNSATNSNHLFWNKIGPFHGFPLLPPTSKDCLLGQLTYKGIAQLLHTGEILHQVYAHSLGLLTNLKLHSAQVSSGQQNSKFNQIDSTPNVFFNSDEIIVYSTRYRRTFQSAMALLFTFLPNTKWLSLNIRESHSMAFCFSDCACPQVDYLRKKLLSLNLEQLSQHPAVSAVVQWIGQSLLQHPANGINNPLEIMDAVLSLLCHNSSLPCRKTNKKVKINGVSVITAPPTTPVDLNNDIINIDQDETTSFSNNNNNNNDGIGNMGDQQKENELPIDACIETSHVAALISYINWQSSIEIHHKYYRQIGLLRAYGMIRHIVSFMLKMISGDRTKFVLYSGHDWTIQYLAAALGIEMETTFIPYASRMAFEVYRSDMNNEYYFRIVFNGKDVTQQIDFCEGGKSLRVTRDSRGNKADLCPIENIIRFIHDDYFSSLNATNFKDACMVQKSNDF